MAKKTPQARKPGKGNAKKGPGVKPPTKKPVLKPAGKVAPKAAVKVVAKAGPKATTKGAPATKVAIKPVVKPAIKVAIKPIPKPSVPASGKPPLVGKSAGVVKPAALAKPVVMAKPVAKGGPASKAPVAKPFVKVVAGAPVAAGVDPKQAGRKGITIVDAKPAPKKPSKSKDKAASVAPLSVGQLLDPKNPIRRPLIPSGPKAAHIRPLGMQGPEEERPVVSGKTPFGKKELAHFRQVLIRKRMELVGDVSQMETEALQGNAGTTSVPQHMAEQGSDTYDQSLALDIAAADRKLIKEIDDAIKRIDAGTFGICELTGKAIKTERLEELPWARYTIEAARELERRSMWA